MPNWVENTAVFEHKDPAMIERAIEGFRRGELFAEFMPTPQELLEYDAPNRNEELTARFVEQYGARDWYDWQVLNWGCKWDVGSNDEASIERLSDKRVRFVFDSAWSPPVDGYRSLCDQDFVIEALYNEPGMQFCGKFTGARGGKRDDYMDYGGHNSHTVREEIGAELDDYFGISENMAMWEEESQDE